MELDFDEASFKKIRSKKFILFLELAGMLPRLLILLLSLSKELDTPMHLMIDCGAMVSFLMNKLTKPSFFLSKNDVRVYDGLYIFFRLNRDSVLFFQIEP